MIRVLSATSSLSPRRRRIGALLRFSSGPRDAQLAAILVAACFALTLSTWGEGTEPEDPEALREAQEDYEDQFFREIESIQAKYRRALRNYKRSFTRNGNLKAAQEADEELRRLEGWKTIPVEEGERSLSHPRLDSLLQSYERAALEVIDPIVQRYLERLRHIKKGFLSTGDLDASLRLEEEIEAVESGRALPANIAGDRYLARLSRSEFEEWLREQTFEFDGKIGGPTTIEFGEDGQLRWQNHSDDFRYDVVDDRMVEIGRGPNSKAFLMRFSQDLQSASFQSNMGVYPVLINGEEPEDFEAVRERP